MSKEQDIVEGNKAIAEFMELNIGNDGKPLDPSVYVVNGYIQTPSMLQYHSSWDWLMPSVKKWNDLVISKRNEGKPGWMKWQYKTVMLRTEIEPVFNDLVSAIQWYQQNQKPQ